MTQLIYSAFLILALLAALHAIFFDLADGAIAVARNNLFEIRARLFRLARQGSLPFDSRTYQMQRQLINGLIRYSHDISWANLLFSKLLRSRRDAFLYRHIAKMMGDDISALSEPVRKEILAISSDSHTEMVLLIVNRSFGLSFFIRGLWLIHCARLAAKQLLSARRDRASPAATCSPEPDPQAVVANSELIQQVRRKWTNKIDRGAWAYTINIGPQLAAA